MIAAALFDNRELALVIWLAVGFTWVLCSKRLRPSLTGVTSAFWHWKILLPFGLMACYVAAWVYGLARIGFWTDDLVSETLFWGFGPALVLMFNWDKAAQDATFFKRTAVALVAYTVALEFVIGLYPFPLVVEFILLPILTLLALVAYYSGTQAEYEHVKRPLEWLLALIGFAFLANAVVHAVRSPDTAFGGASLREFFLPVVLSLALLPYIYAVALIATYEGFFLRIGFVTDDKALERYTKRRVLLRVGPRIGRLRRFTGINQVELARAESKDEIDRTIERILKDEGTGIAHDDS